MAANYVLLSERTVTSNVSSVTFSNIPQTGYTDLVVKFSARSDRINVDQLFTVRFNGSSANLSSRRLETDGSTTTSNSDNAEMYAIGTGNNATANTFGNSEIYIPNYTSSNFKSVLIDAVSETNATNATTLLLSGLWANTAAITSIALAPNGGQAILPGSTFYLYGVAKLGVEPVIAPKATGGDIIVNDGTYWYHAFLSSGTFTTNRAISCDYLVVAGGGGGAVSNANGLGMGGGGAGGLRSTVTVTGGGGSLESPLSLATGTAYTVTIGAGGNGGFSNISGSLQASNGSNSVFASVTSTGGGRGGNQNGAPTSGGSGGGDCGDAAGQSPGAGTSGQGYAGGNSGASSGAGSGGGGAGAVGGSSSGASTGGAGGAGVQITALATPTNTGVSSGYYAGGGGGSANTDGGGTPAAGAGGIGGGGAGGLGLTPATNGTAFTGGGGGAGGSTGSSFTTPSGYGGSGIVIVRYTVA